ncbi:MAG: hypothetical protein WCY19_08555 [Candidatus Gastranaerophilaceae bacterium]
MKKLLLTLIVLMFGLGVFAADQDDALGFFNSFVSTSNSYSPALLNMYSDNAKIIRQVVKPNGQLVNVPFSINDYRKQLSLSSKLARMRGYKNYYSDINVTKVANGYRIESMRKPSLSDYKLKSSMVVQKQANGKWLIVEELMQTKEQIFLKYAK